MSEKQPYQGSPRLRQSNMYGGVPYLPPERIEHHHDQAVAPLAARSKAFRVLVTGVFLGLAIIQFIQAGRAAVHMAALSADPGPDPHWSAAATGLIAPIVLGLLFLIYPVVNLVRLRRRHTAR